MPTEEAADSQRRGVKKGLIRSVCACVILFGLAIVPPRHQALTRITGIGCPPAGAGPGTCNRINEQKETWRNE